MTKRISLSLAAALIFSSAAPLFVAAEGTATLAIEQVSPTRVGTWTLMYPEGTVKSSEVGINAKKHTLYPKIGTMVLSLTPPAGNSAIVKVYKDGELIETKSIPQVSLTLEEGATYKVIAQYTFDKLGTIGVTSTPNKQSFKLTGPDGKIYRGTTPASFKNIPAGSYKLQMNAKKDCIQPRVEHRKLEANERETIEVVYNCSTTVRQALVRGPSKRAIRNASAEREAARAAARRR